MKNGGRRWVCPSVLCFQEGAREGGVVCNKHRSSTFMKDANEWKEERMNGRAGGSDDILLFCPLSRSRIEQQAAAAAGPL